MNSSWWCLGLFEGSWVFLIGKLANFDGASMPTQKVLCRELQCHTSQLLRYSIAKEGMHASTGPPGLQPLRPATCWVGGKSNLHRCATEVQGPESCVRVWANLCLASEC